MTDSDLRSGVIKLSETVTQLSKAVAHQAENTTGLSTQVRESNERTEANRKTLKRLSFLMIAKLLTLVLLVVLFANLRDTNDAIRSCTTPEGACAQRNAAVTGQFLRSGEFRAERQRLTTELPIAQQKGDTVRVDALQKRLDELNASIADADNRIAQIQSGAVSK